MTFEDFCVAINTDKLVVDAIQAKRAFEAGMAPAEACQYFMQNKLYKKKPKVRRKASLPQAEIERRLALAIHRECSRLMLRALEGPARQFVVQTMISAEKKLGIYRA